MPLIYKADTSFFDKLPKFFQNFAQELTLIVDIMVRCLAVQGNVVKNTANLWRTQSAERQEKFLVDRTCAALRSSNRISQCPKTPASRRVLEVYR